MQPTPTTPGPPRPDVGKLGQARAAARDANLAALRAHAEASAALRRGDHGQATVPAQTSRQIQEAAERHRDLAARLTDPHRLTIPAEVPVRDMSPAFPLASAQRRTAILQPPKPEIPPSSRILERVAGRDRDPEAAD